MMPQSYQYDDCQLICRKNGLKIDAVQALAVNTIPQLMVHERTCKNDVISYVLLV